MFLQTKIAHPPGLLFGDVFEIICIFLFIILYHYENYINTKNIGKKPNKM